MNPPAITKAPAIGPEVINAAAPVLESVEDSAAASPDSLAVIPEEVMVASEESSADIEEDDTTTVVFIVVVSADSVMPILDMTVVPPTTTIMVVEPSELPPTEASSLKGTAVNPAEQVVAPPVPKLKVEPDPPSQQMRLEMSPVSIPCPSEVMTSPSQQRFAVMEPWQPIAPD